MEPAPPDCHDCVAGRPPADPEIVARQPVQCGDGCALPRARPSTLAATHSLVGEISRTQVRASLSAPAPHMGTNEEEPS
jgi:hypothetical protein